jgi:hypothetical protein
MSRPPISTRKLSETLTLSECHPTADHKGRYWLYDSTIRFNLAMGAETEEAALLKALKYYQDQLSRYKADHRSLRDKVNRFIRNVTGDFDL